MRHCSWRRLGCALATVGRLDHRKTSGPETSRPFGSREVNRAEQETAGCVQLRVLLAELHGRRHRRTPATGYGKTAWRVSLVPGTFISTVSPSIPTVDQGSLRLVFSPLPFFHWRSSAVWFTLHEVLTHVGRHPCPLVSSFCLEGPC